MTHAEMLKAILAKRRKAELLSFQVALPPESSTTLLYLGGWAALPQQKLAALTF